MLEKLQAIRERYLHLEEQLSDPSTASDVEKSKKVNKEYKKLQPIMQTAARYEKAMSNLSSARSILSMESDPEMREMARDEIAMLEPECTTLEDELKTLLTPKDPVHLERVLHDCRAQPWRPAL